MFSPGLILLAQADLIRIFFKTLFSLHLDQFSLSLESMAPVLCQSLLLLLLSFPRPHWPACATIYVWLQPVAGVYLSSCLTVCENLIYLTEHDEKCITQQELVLFAL